MALNASGNISLAGDRSGESIALELGRSPVEEITLNDTDVRTLIGIGSGAIGMNVAYSKSRILTRNITLTNNQLEFVLAPNIITGYSAGTTAVTLTINSGVYVYSDNTSRAGLTVTGFAAGDTVSIINNGFIIGRGGNGGYRVGLGGSQVPPTAGGPALRINNDVTITNNSYIAGGGGGGGGGGEWSVGGGGGAGGGRGGPNAGGTAILGGGPGLAGANGLSFVGYDGNQGSGGGGGRILPGVGGTGGTSGGSLAGGRGGGAGGGGGGYFIGGDTNSGEPGGAGGGASNNGIAGSAGVGQTSAGGGGGGWGAAGGRSQLSLPGGEPYPGGNGAAGGAAIVANNNAIFFLTNGTIYGSLTGNKPVGTATLSANTSNYTFNPAKITGYVAGNTVAVLVIDPGVYLYSTATNTPALTISGWATGDQVRIINNGYIMGRGGNGGGWNGSVLAPTAGGPAISLAFNVTIENNSYIGGGGGGGGRGGLYVGGAGGGAGGGTGGPCQNVSNGTVAGGAGGNPGAAGANGTAHAGTNGSFKVGGGSGGGGGRIMPGTGGAGGAAVTDPATLNTATRGGGGGAGGGSGSGRVNDGSTTVQNYTGVAGGSAGNTGTNNTGADASAGGGGWGAAGGTGGSTSGGAGGKAVNLNGYTVTWNPVGTRYGAIS